MRTRAKAGLVAAGYLLAIVAGCVAGAAYDARMAKMPYDTSGGMYAAGQLLTSLGAFLAVALIQTALAAWFLRRWFWRIVVIAGVCLLLMIAGCAALFWFAPRPSGH